MTSVLPLEARRALQRAMVEKNDKRKQSLYFPEEMLQEIQQQATRQDRSLSWIIQQAWRLARARIASIPGMNDSGPSAQ